MCPTEERWVSGVMIIAGYTEDYSKDDRTQELEIDSLCSSIFGLIAIDTYKIP